MNKKDTGTDCGAPQLITMLTDFGIKDPFVGVMKGVIHGIHPAARTIDLTHEVPPQDVRSGSFMLLCAYRYFPPGTVHLAVVDPGVGTERRALVIATNRHLFVGPDNGILTWAALDDGIRFSVSITNDEYLLPQPSTTFHGRDVFAPAAAHLCRGVNPEDLGGKIDDVLMLDFPHPEIHSASRIVGAVIHTDRFGNLITNVRLTDDERARVTKVKLKNVSIPGISITYMDGDPGEPLALVGSSGFVEIACSQSSAAFILGAHRDDEVIFDLED
ncbi:MAG: SAM-dependent chlorinase/fluorinase [Deltaproteobacteria bacterium]|nr:SAM-dependent chlorinase/fluorinase [Candidatus Zymogenaceae bacterium]